MDHTQSPSTPFKLIKKYIPIRKQTNEKIKTFIYLLNEKCAVLFQTFCLIVDLNLERNDQEIVIPTPKIWSIFRVGQNIGYDQHHGRHSSSYYVVDSKGKSIDFKKAGGTFSSNTLLPFYHSGKVFANMSMWTSKWFVELSKGKNQISFKEEQNPSSKADDKQCIFLSTKDPQKRWVFNLSTREKYEIIIPKSPYPQSFYFRAMYMINSQEVIFSTVIKQKAVIIGIVSLGVDGKYENILQLPGYDYAEFSIMNSQMCIIMIALCQYGNTKNRLLPSKKIFLNYKTKKIIYQLIDNEEQRLSPDKVSPNFDHFLIGIDEKRRIIDSRPQDVRKLYMHIIKKSRLEEAFGNCLAQRIIKVII